MTLRLESPAFAPGGRIPDRFTCEGGDASPPLGWSGAPQGTRGYALVCSDPDAPSGTFYHWAVYDIPAEAHGLAERQRTGERGGPYVHALNDFGRPGMAAPARRAAMARIAIASASTPSIPPGSRSAPIPAAAMSSVPRMPTPSPRRSLSAPSRADRTRHRTACRNRPHLACSHGLPHRQAVRLPRHDAAEFG